MTFAELYGTKLSELLANSSTDYYTTTDRKRWVNEGYQAINNLLRPLRSYQSSTIPAATATVALPTDFEAFAGEPATWTESGQLTTLPLARLSVAELNARFPGWQDADYPTGTPAAYLYEPQVSTGEAVTLVPTPAAAGTLYFEYHPTMTALSADSDVPWGGLFPAFHHLLAHEAEVLARHLDADPDLTGEAERRRDEVRALFQHYLTTKAPPRQLSLRVPLARSRWRTH